jgi:hypothetical protein
MHQALPHLALSSLLPSRHQGPFSGLSLLHQGPLLDVYRDESHPSRPTPHPRGISGYAHSEGPHWQKAFGLYPEKGFPNRFNALEGEGAVWIQHLLHKYSGLSAVFGELEGINMMVAAVAVVAGRGHARDKHRDRSCILRSIMNAVSSAT